jgi:hypothetical protein
MADEALSKVFAEEEDDAPAASFTSEIDFSDLDALSAPYADEYAQ